MTGTDFGCFAEGKLGLELFDVASTASAGSDAMSAVTATVIVNQRMPV
ncbi:hypothetical protein ACFQ2B_11695 [Streptomyces stramineus]